MLMAGTGRKELFERVVTHARGEVQFAPALPPTFPTFHAFGGNVMDRVNSEGSAAPVYPPAG